MVAPAETIEILVVNRNNQFAFEHREVLHGARLMCGGNQLGIWLCIQQIPFEMAGKIERSQNAQAAAPVGARQPGSRVFSDHVDDGALH